jgi:hypothetical protein
MAGNKTSKNSANVVEFIESIESDRKRNDSYQIIEIMTEITRAEPVMWGSSIIGFGDSSYTTADGKKHDNFNLGFSPRKQNIAMYLLTGYEKYGEIMDRLGKYKTGKVCLYINKLADVDVEVLKEIIQVAYERSLIKE